MSRLQIRLLGPYFGSFSAHSYDYELSNEPNSGLKLPNFRFGPYSPTPSWCRKTLAQLVRVDKPRLLRKCLKTMDFEAALCYHSAHCLQ
jgi:hypothetical protein